jgi:hypothetical protein
MEAVSTEHIHTDVERESPFKDVVGKLGQEFAGEPIEAQEAIEQALYRITDNEFGPGVCSEVADGDIPLFKELLLKFCKIKKNSPEQKAGEDLAIANRIRTEILTTLEMSPLKKLSS